MRPDREMAGLVRRKMEYTAHRHLRDRLWTDVLTNYRQVRQRPASPGRRTSTPKVVTQHRVLRFAAAAAVLLAILWVVLRVTHSSAGLQNSGTRRQARQETNPGVRPYARRLEREQTKARALFAAGDIGGLIALLESGLSPTQALTARYLAELRASEAIPALQRLAETWSGTANTNPFTEVLAHLGRQDPNAGPVERSSSPGEETPPVSVAPAGKVLEVRITAAATGHPLPGTSVRAYADGRRDYVCDANGCCRIELGQDLPQRFEMIISQPGYVGMCVRLEDLDAGILAAPYRLALETGTCIGGIVQDVNGAPIEGADVELYLHPEHSLGPHLHVRHRQQTDSDGRWSCDSAPANLEQLAERGELAIQIKHAMYARDRCEVRDMSGVKALGELSHRITMYAGHHLYGWVRDAQGNPVGSATVSSVAGGTKDTTGPDGTFVIPHVHPRATSVALQIRAEGYAPTDEWIDWRPDMEPVEIVLRPGFVIAARVVDAQGVPVSGAMVIVRTRITRIWSGSTDDDGCFATPPLSADMVGLAVDKEGFMGVGHWLPPENQDLDLVLYRPLRVSGLVVDAGTGEPIQDFRIRPCQVTGSNGNIGWGSDTFAGHGGRYEHTFTGLSENGYVIVAEADGYLPAESRIIAPHEQIAVADLAPTTGTGPAGRAVDSQGLPAVRVTVFALHGNHELFLKDGEVATDNKEPSTRTGPDGQFAFEPIYQLTGLVAMGPQGIGEITLPAFEATGRLVLQPWAEIRGTVWAGGLPARDWPMELRTHSPGGGWQALWSTHTDEHGRFRITKLPPGTFTLLGHDYQAGPGDILVLDLSTDTQTPSP